jgi:signal transduction histidine kinase
LNRIVAITSRYVSSGPLDGADEVVDPASPPIGKAFVGFVVTLVACFAATLIERELSWTASPSTVSQLGMVGTTVFLVAGLAALYRAVTTKTPTIAPIVAMLLGPGALWCWLVFVKNSATGAFAATLVVLAASVVGVLLLAEGIWKARWLGVFCGLGAVGISMAATMVRNDPEIRATVSLALLVAFAGMACLYGTLVEIESSGRKTFEQLLDAKRKIEAEIAETESLLHDLRSGLLSIEAAMAGVDEEVGAPIRTETARLRNLASRRRREVGEFDLVPGIRDMTTARRAGGLVVDLRLPSAAQVIGERSEVLSVIDNMLSNAQRHGASPVRLELQEQGPLVHVAVIDSGKVATDADTNGFFRRGFSTHKDGDGIGLDRARALAELNGGSVNYIPGPNGETSFVFTLPSAAGHHEQARPTAMSWSAQPPVATS